VSKRSVFLLAVFTILTISFAHAQGPYLWEADTGLGGITDKVKIGEYLDNLKAHSINGVWVQVELYGEGSVNYKKTTLSGLPTAEKFKTGQWAEDDFLSYVIAQAKQRGMKVMIDFHGSNWAAWDQHPDWRKLDSKGKEIMLGGKIKNFCVNSPYWDKMFFPMLREIAANYDVDGFYLETSQVAYETEDSCFCPQCKARFKAETVKDLPLKPVTNTNWTDPLVKQHAIKRVEWMNKFYEKYRQTIDEAKPGAMALLTVGGGDNSYKDSLSARHAGKYVTYLTPKPENTPRFWALAKTPKLTGDKRLPVDESKLAREEVIPWMSRYGYMEFMVKTMLADGGGKPVLPICRFWLGDRADMGGLEVEKWQIESAIGGGAKGYCFFGYLANALATGKTMNSTWESPAFKQYLKDLTTGPRAQWIADMHPDPRIGIIYDREADFWTADYWKRLRAVGGIYADIQFLKKLPVGLIAASEPDADGFGKTGYKIDVAALKGYDLIYAPGIDWLCKEDLQTLRDYVDKGGRLVIMGGIGHNGKFLGEPLTDEAYQILGVTTSGKPEPSGFLVDPAKHPLFMSPTGFSGPMNTSRVSDDKNGALTYQPKYDKDWNVLVWEVNDNGRRAAIIAKEKAENTIAYLNTDMASDFSVDLRVFVQNMPIVFPVRTTSIQTLDFTLDSSVNSFRSADGLRRYVHVFTPNGEKAGATMRIRPDANMTPVSAEIIINGGEPTPIRIFGPGEPYAIGQIGQALKGTVNYKLPALPSGFAMIKITYEKSK